jgi:bifunctional N-acetylglucosamine-1-phosphate-uridyltransferase/glucosamine-1-phosphate-acetyltransferase GlmU-like protein
MIHDLIAVQIEAAEGQTEVAETQIEAATAWGVEIQDTVIDVIEERAATMWKRNIIEAVATVIAENIRAVVELVEEISQNRVEDTMIFDVVPLVLKMIIGMEVQSIEVDFFLIIIKCS